MDLHRLQRDSAKAGYENAYLAWAVDELAEERKQGTTIQNSVFSVCKSKVLNFFDTPGLEDFISETISASQIADIAIVAIDASVRKNKQEKVYAPTKDAGYLARSLGINQVIAFITKIDAIPNNSEAVIREFEDKAREIMKEVGFKDECIRVMSGSSLETNISERIIQNVLEIERGSKEELKPLRLMIDDCYRLVHGKLLGYCLCGFLASGLVEVGQKICIEQAGIRGKVKEIMKAGEKVRKVMAGDWVDITLTDFEGEFREIRRGFVLASPEYPITLASKLRIRGITNDLKVPLLKKQELILCIGNIRTQVTIVKILREIIGKQVKNKPRGLRWKTIGDIDVNCHMQIPVEKYKNLQRLGRCLLLDKNRIVFAGMILEVLD